MAVLAHVNQVVNFGDTSTLYGRLVQSKECRFQVHELFCQQSEIAIRTNHISEMLNRARAPEVSVMYSKKQLRNCTIYESTNN